MNNENIYIKLSEYKHFYILLLLIPGGKKTRLEGSIPRLKKKKQPQLQTKKYEANISKTGKYILK